jgi:hypothetical protein
MHELHDVMTVNVIADLLAFVTKDAVGLAFEVALDEVAQETMQLYAAVIRSGKTAAAQRSGRHSEIAAVFLHHNVRRHFRRAKNGVFRLINAKRFLDAIGVIRIGVIPPLLQFLQRDLVRRVAIHLVRAHVDERRFRTRLPRGFEHVQRAAGVHIKIIERARRCEIVARLRGSVNNGARFDFLQQRQHCRASANIQFVMLEILVRRSEPLLVPTRIAARSEEIRAHIVVHAVNFPTELAKMFNDL